MTITPALVSSVANAGRSVNLVSPLVSRPVVTLKGMPERAVTSGLKLMPQGIRTKPPKIKRWRTSIAARPNSVLRSYELTGKVNAPSVSLFAWLKT